MARFHRREGPRAIVRYTQVGKVGYDTVEGSASFNARGLGPPLLVNSPSSRLHGKPSLLSTLAGACTTFGISQPSN